MWEDLEANYPPGSLLLSEAERKDDAELSYLASPLGLALQMVKKMFRRLEGGRVHWFIHIFRGFPVVRSIMRVPNSPGLKRRL